MTLFIVHHHLRPGGIRRVIELATPCLVRESPRTITRVVLATGQRADRSWHEHFAQQLPGVRVEVKEKHPFDGPLVLRVDGNDRTLGATVANQVFVQKSA